MLSPQDRAILAIAGRWYRYDGAREAAMRDELDLSPTRFAQRLNALIDDPDALAHAPVLVNRLRRQRSMRLRARSLRRAGCAETRHTALARLRDKPLCHVSRAEEVGIEPTRTEALAVFETVPDANPRVAPPVV